MAIYAMIGGQSDCPNRYIEKHLLELTKKECPVILYCPYAAVNQIKSIEKFHKQMDVFHVDIIDLTMENINEFETLLSKCDIFYVGGGHCDELVLLFKEYKLDEVLRKYSRKDIIYAGSSAGAMLYTIISMGDRYVFTDNFHKYNYKMTPGLGLKQISICPHYQEEDLILYNDKVKEYPFPSFGIEEDTMLVFIDKGFYVVKNDRTHSLYYFCKEEGYQMIPLYEGEIYEENSGTWSKRNL